MFAPSFVTGHLISRLGLTRIMLTGVVLLLLCSLINLSGLATLNFWAANVALGVGWNILFVGATTLLTRTYGGAERGKVQAFNEFLVFGTVTLSSFASGAMLSGAGWIMVQIAVVPFVVVAGATVCGGATATRAALRCYALLSPCKQDGHDALKFRIRSAPAGRKGFQRHKVPPRRRPSAANTGNIRHRKGGQPTLDAAPSLTDGFGGIRTRSRGQC